MSGGSEPVRATFWLLQASDSLSEQSRREPDGAGIGFFDGEDRPVVSKQPIAAFEDRRFAEEAKDVQARTIVAHVRFASTGALTVDNTHPFEQDGRLFAHNGAIEGLPALESELGPEGMALVHGDTDSERWFALITRAIARADGDVAAGIESATRWLAANLPRAVGQLRADRARSAVGAALPGGKPAARARARGGRWRRVGTRTATAPILHRPHSRRLR